jgi:hypothetical protein
VGWRQVSLGRCCAGTMPVAYIVEGCATVSPLPFPQARTCPPQPRDRRAFPDYSDQIHGGIYALLCPRSSGLALESV